MEILILEFETAFNNVFLLCIKGEALTLEQFIQMLVATQARIFDFQLHIMIASDTKDELDLKKIQVRNYLDALGMRGDQYKRLLLHFVNDYEAITLHLSTFHYQKFLR